MYLLTNMIAFVPITNIFLEQKKIGNQHRYREMNHETSPEFDLAIYPIIGTLTYVYYIRYKNDIVVE
jgi:hypothetical protein